MLDEENLPDTHEDISTKKKGETEVSGLQLRLEDTVDELGYPTPTATPQLGQVFKTLGFVNHLEHEIGNGLLPAALTLPGATTPEARKQLHCNQEAAEDYNLVGDKHTNLSDAKALQNTKGCVVQTWMEAEIQLECHVVVTATAFGKDHQNVTNQVDALATYKSLKLQLQAAMNEEYGKRLTPAFFVHW